MAEWHNDSSLFLRFAGSGHEPQLWKCKKMDSQELSLTYGDFDEVRTSIQNFTELSPETPTWNDLEFKKLLQELQSKNILVNCEGVMYIEIPTSTSDGLSSTLNGQLFKLANIVDMPRYGLSKLASTPIPDHDACEPWINDYSNKAWLPVDQLTQPKWTGMELKTIAKSNELIENDVNTTNVKASYFLRPMQNGYTWPQYIVKPEDLTPNAHKARFDPKIWTVFYHKANLYVGTYYI